MRKRTRGQSTLEYAVIIAVIVGALLAMQIYMKRGMQGRMRQATDEIGKQFEAEDTKVTYTTNRTGKTVEKTQSGATTVYAGHGSTGTSEITTFKGSEEVSAWGSDVEDEN